MLTAMDLDYMTASHRFILQQMTEKGPLSSCHSGCGVSQGNRIKQKWRVAENAQLIKCLLQQLFCKQSTPYIPKSWTHKRITGWCWLRLHRLSPYRAVAGTQCRCISLMIEMWCLR